MKYERMIEMNLQHHFGYVQKISEADLLVGEDEEVIINHLDQKDAKAIRIESAKTHQKHIDRIRKFADYRFEIEDTKMTDMWSCHSWNQIETGKLRNLSLNKKRRQSGQKECREYTSEATIEVVGEITERSSAEKLWDNVFDEKKFNLSYPYFLRFSTHEEDEEFRTLHLWEKEAAAHDKFEMSLKLLDCRNAIDEHASNLKSEALQKIYEAYKLLDEAEALSKESIRIQARQLSCQRID